MPSWCGQVWRVQEEKVGEAGASGSAGRPGGAWEVAFMEGVWVQVAACSKARKGGSDEFREPEGLTMWGGEASGGLEWLIIAPSSASTGGQTRLSPEPVGQTAPPPPCLREPSSSTTALPF